MADVTLDNEMLKGPRKALLSRLFPFTYHVLERLRTVAKPGNDFSNTMAETRVPRSDVGDYRVGVF